jgi:hypothetical protein
MPYEGSPAVCGKKGKCRLDSAVSRVKGNEDKDNSLNSGGTADFRPETIDFFIIRFGLFVFVNNFLGDIKYEKRACKKLCTP